MDFRWTHPHPRIWLCECSPQNAYRLRIEMVLDPPDRAIAYVVQGEWLERAPDYIFDGAGRLDWLEVDDART